MRNKVSAGVIFIRKRNNYPRGWDSKKKIHSKFFFLNSLTVPKFDAECRKKVIPYQYALRRTIAYAFTFPNPIAYLKIFIPYLNTLTRLSPLDLNTCIAYLNTLSRLFILINALPIFIHTLPILIP